MTRFAWLVLVFAFGIIAAGLSPVAGQEADAQLAACFKQYLEECFRLRPMDATRLGDHRFDHLLDDLGPKAREAWTAHARKTLEELPRRVEFDKLSRDGKIDFAVFKHELEKSLWSAENLRPFERDPRIYNDYTGDSVFMLLAQSTLPKETNITHAVARMAHIPKVIEAAKSNLKDPPRVATETAILQNRGAIGFFERGLFEMVGQSPQLERLKAAAQPVAACLKEYQEFLERDLLPRSKGQWRLGEAKFAKKLEWELDAGLTADQVLADAEAEFLRVERDMYVIARQLWGRYPAEKQKGTGTVCAEHPATNLRSVPGFAANGTSPLLPLPPDDPAGRHATIAEVLRQVAQDHGPPEDLTRDARATVARIKSFIADRGILRLPEPDRCQVIEMPEFQRGNSTAYMNSAPPLDPRAASIYAVSPPPKDWDAARVKSLLEEYNRHMLQILTIHEAYPGHYVQLEYSNRNPSLIRRVLSSGVYVEGWAVYTEQMMLDQGYGDGDLALRLTQLKFYLRAVANAILDHRMHCGQMTDDEALRFLTHEAFQSEGEARLKIIRAKQTSCQLSTYFVGRMAMVRLRQQIQREMGADFDLGRYHEAVLDLGSLPVKYLPELVKERLKRR